MKNISMIHPERVFDIHGTFAFDAATAIARNRKAIFKRLFQPLIDTC